MRKLHVTPDQLKEAIASSTTWEEAAKALQCSERSVRRYAKKAGIDFGPQTLTASTSESISKVEKLRQENAALKNIIQELSAQKEQADILSGIFEESQRPGRVDAPKWAVSAPKKKGMVILNAFFSDWHYGEVVVPAEVEGMNGFDTHIADMRIRNCYVNTVRLGVEYLAGVTASGIVTPYGGDMFSGNIHDELVETNELAMTDCFISLYEQILAGTDLLLEQFGRVYMPWVVGNHPRLSIKKKAKRSVRNNFDYLLGKMVQNHYQGNDKVTVDVAGSKDLMYSVFKTRYNLTHGDQFRGGSGIAGLLSPLMIGDARKRKRAGSVNRPYDKMIMGHWHQRESFRGIMVNGSLKGYDEYAYENNFDYQEPLQSFWVDDPEHGITITAPIHCKSDKEAWLSEGVQSFVME